MIVILVLCILLLERDFCVCYQITSEYIAARPKSFSISTAVTLCHQFVKYINIMANNKRQTRWNILEQCWTNVPVNSPLKKMSKCFSNLWRRNQQICLLFGKMVGFFWANLSIFRHASQMLVNVHHRVSLLYHFRLPSAWHYGVCFNFQQGHGDYVPTWEIARPIVVYRLAFVHLSCISPI